MDPNAIERAIEALYQRVTETTLVGTRAQEQRAAAIAEMKAMGSPLATAMALGMEATGVRLTGDLARARSLLDTAMEQIEALDQPLWKARLLTGLCHWFAASEQWSEIPPIAQQALEDFGDHPADLWTLSALSALRDANATSGNINAAIEISKRMIELAQNSSMFNGEAWARIQLAHLFTWAGQPEEALEHVMRAYDMAEQYHFADALERANQNLAILYSQCGELMRALEYAYKGLELCRSRNSPSTATHLITIAIIHNDLGDVDRSIELNREAMEVAHNDGPRSHEAAAIGNMAEGYLARGEHDTALEAVDRAIAIHQQVNSGAGLEFALALRAAILVGAGRLDEAEQALSTLDIRSIKNARIRFSAFETVADLAIKLGDRQRARDILLLGLTQATASKVLKHQVAFHKRLRDLALLDADLAAYVEHNDAFVSLTEELRGADVMRKAALHEREREIQAERQERERERAVLYSTLPAHVADRIIRGEDVSGDKHDHASVLFLDVVGFTTHASALDPQVTTQLLDKVFETFDEICERHGVTKIKTIGDSYLAVAFGEAASTEQRTANVALEMMAAEFYWPREASPEGSLERLAFRIGIHSGPVVAGVIGKQRLQYDVWGDTVNVASRMESTGEPGRIQVSSEFHEQLSNRAGSPVSDLRSPTFTERGEVDIKGRGQMTTFWLESATS